MKLSLTELHCVYLALLTAERTAENAAECRKVLEMLRAKSQVPVSVTTVMSEYLSVRAEASSV